MAVTLDGSGTQHPVWRPTDTIPEVTARLVLALIEEQRVTLESRTDQTKHSDPAEGSRAAPGTCSVSQATLWTQVS